MSKSTHLCVFVLMGLPGAGKSTLSKYFIEKTEENHKDENAEIVHICYDELSKHVYKTKNYKVFRNQALDYIEHNLKLYLPIINKKIILLVDDIMYYSSMRKQVYTLCKKYNVSYCQVYINIPHQEAINRNETRTSDERYERILPESIYEMSTKIEVPSSEPWERFTYQIDGLKKLNDEVINNIWDTIKSSLLCPVLSSESFDKASEAESSKQASNLHKLDIVLRKFISSYIVKMKKKDPFINISILGKELSSKKKSFMEKFNVENLNIDNLETEESIKKLFEEYLVE